MDGNYLTSFDGAKIYYHKTIKDKEKMLIFLHGLGGDLTAWQKERRYFDSQNFSTIAMDLRGHGLSDRGNNIDFYRFENFAKDLAMLLEKEAINHPVIIGHCFGGIISMYFQVQYPKYSKGLVLIDTSFKPPFISDSFVSKILLGYIFNLLLKITPDLRQKGRANSNKFIDTGDIDLQRLASDILHTSLHSYLLISENLLQLDARELLERIIIPALVIEGTKDSIFPPKVAKYISSRIKHSQLDMIEGANHIIVLNNPEAVEKSIVDFLEKINF